MFDFFETYGLQSLTLQAIVFRLTLALICGGALGLERTSKRRAAGFRTHILVCIGSALVMMCGQFIFENIGGADPSRLGAQVISGIGFLGAGTILVTGAHQIKGLTTAAALWASACMGIAIGIGFYVGAILTAVFVLVVMAPLDLLQTRFLAYSRFIQLFIILEDFDNINDFFELCKQNNIHVDDFEIIQSPTGSGLAILVMLRFKKRMSHQESINIVRVCPGLLSIEET